MQRGFAAIPNHVIRDATIPASARLLYGIILSYAFAGRRCTASTARLCDEAGIGRSAFFDALRILTDRSLLSVEKVRTDRGWRNTYAPVVKPVGIDEDPGDRSPESVQPSRGSSAQPDGGSSAQPDTEEDQVEEDHYTERVSGRENGTSLSVVEPSSWSFSGRTVPTQHRQAALDVLGEFNRQAGTNFAPFGVRGPSEHLKRVTGAVLDHPTATLADWRKLIGWTLEHPWWPDGTPSIGVVFGPKVIDDNIERCRQSIDPRRNGNGSNGHGDLIRDLLTAGGELS